MSPGGEAVLAVTVSRGRSVRNRVATALMVVAFLVAAVPLVYVIVVVAVKGAGVIGADWFTKDIPTNVASAALADKFGGEPEKIIYGMLPAIYGTLLITLTAAAMAVPLGILGAVYLNEYGGRGRLAAVVRFFADVMSGVPSVIMGVFIYTIWVLNVGERSGFAGALALACLMLPIVVRSTEEMLRLVPDALREGSLAMGAAKWQTTLRVVLPAALPGITSGCMIAVARAAGETAPLLLTIGSVSALNLGLGGQNTALAPQIFGNATVPGGVPIAWGAALTLIVLVLALTLLARWVSSRFAIAGQHA